MRFTNHRFFAMMCSMLLLLSLQLQAVNVDEPQVAINRNGHKVAVFREFINGVGHIKASVLRHCSNTWTTPVVISTMGDHAIGPLVRVDNKFQAIAIWAMNDDENGVTALMAAKKDTNDTWSPPVRLSAITEHVELDEYRLEVNAIGHIAVIWRALDFAAGAPKIKTRQAKLSNFDWSPEAALDP